jgi:curved DNA-binding protein CbpA/DNA-directed RNA polymerase subunit RPC12/RpoP
MPDHHHAAGPDRTAYHVLQLDVRASHELVQAAYWVLVGLAKGGSGGAGVSPLRELNDAYETLGRPEARKHYDAEHGFDQQRPPLRISEHRRRPFGRATRRVYVSLTGYEVLHVAPHAIPGVIDAAYRILRSELSGTGAGEPELEREAIEEAYATLRDPKRRAAYDLTLAPASPPAPPTMVPPVAHPTSAEDRRRDVIAPGERTSGDSRSHLASASAREAEHPALSPAPAAVSVTSPTASSDRGSVWTSALRAVSRLATARPSTADPVSERIAQLRYSNGGSAPRDTLTATPKAPLGGAATAPRGGTTTALEIEAPAPEASEIPTEFRAAYAPAAPASISDALSTPERLADTAAPRPRQTHRATCSACGTVYSRVGRRPQKGRRNYCPDCGSAAAHRDRQRDYRSRRVRGSDDPTGLGPG